MSAEENMNSSNIESYIWKIPETIQPQKEVICSGYARLNFESISIDIIKLLAYYYDIKTAVTVSRLKEAKQGKFYDSNVFELHGFQWFLKIYSNGTLHRTEGKTDLYLYLATIPPKLSSISVKYRLYCIETEIDDSSINQYTKKNHSSGWNLTIDKELVLKSNLLTFGVDIQLLSGYDIENNQLSNKQIQDMLLNKKKYDAERNNELQLIEILKRVETIENKMNKYNETMLSTINSLKKSIDMLSLNNIGVSQQKVKLWLEKEVKLPQYFGIFILNGIDDLNIIKLITMDMLNNIGIDKIGHRIKILYHVEQLKQTLYDTEQ